MLNELFQSETDANRIQKDNVVTGFGNILLNLCIAYSMCILNGRVGDDKGVSEYTYHGHVGCVS